MIDDQSAIRKHISFAIFITLPCKKNEISYTLLAYYCKIYYRYLTWCGKINKNRFKEKFGSPDKVQVKGRSMKKLFKRHNKVYLGDEFRTATMLYDHPGINEKGVELENFWK